MLGSPILYLKGMRILMFQLSGIYYKGLSQVFLSRALQTRSFLHTWFHISFSISLYICICVCYLFIFIYKHIYICEYIYIYITYTCACTSHARAYTCRYVYVGCMGGELKMLEVNWEYACAAQSFYKS